jgi:hypothetical protein
MLKRLIVIGVSVIALLSLGSVSPASAAAHGYCTTGDFCLYYNTGYTGGVIGFTSDASSYAGLEFTGGAGAGQSVDNNAASVWNRNSFCIVVIWTGRSMTGNHRAINPGEKLNLKGTVFYNAVSSHSYGCNG